jgi:hypothetical protein
MNRTYHLNSPDHLFKRTGTSECKKNSHSAALLHLDLAPTLSTQKAGLTLVQQGANKLSVELSHPLACMLKLFFSSVRAMFLESSLARLNPTAW